jgi:hypothetical protein
MTLSEGKYPMLMRYYDPVKVESPMDELVRDLNCFSLDPKSNCMICALPLKDNELIYMNRKADIYHKACFEKFSSKPSCN